MQLPAHPDRISPRSIYDRLKGKADEDMLFVLMGLAEDLAAQRREIYEMAQSIDRMASTLGLLAEAAHGMRAKIDSMRREDLDERVSPYVQATAPEEDG